MPITTDAELYSASNWYPSPAKILPSEGLGDVGDLQTVSWVFGGLVLSLGGYVPSMSFTLLPAAAVVVRTTLGSAALQRETLLQAAPVSVRTVFPNAPIVKETVIDG